MTFTKARFASFEEDLTADASDLPEGRCEYWDGELVPVRSESLGNEAIANFLHIRPAQRPHLLRHRSSESRTRNDRLGKRS